MYTLTLSKDERKAIDWIGYRYSHGDEFRAILEQCEATDEWDCDGDVTYTMHENQAWLADSVITEDDLVCFAPTLVDKLLVFCSKIV